MLVSHKLPSPCCHVTAPAPKLPSPCCHVPTTKLHVQEPRLPSPHAQSAAPLLPTLLQHPCCPAMPKPALVPSILPSCQRKTRFKGDKPHPIFMGKRMKKIKETLLQHPKHDRDAAAGLPRPKLLASAPMRINLQAGRAIQRLGAAPPFFYAGST